MFSPFPQKSVITIQCPQGKEQVSGSDDKATGTAATPTPATGTAAEPENQPVPVSVAPVHKKECWKQKSARLVREETLPLLKEEVDQASYSEAGPSLELEAREAKQLGSLSREGSIDKEIGKGAQVLSLWRQLLSGVKERYPFKEEIICYPGKWTTMERGIQ
ncbi:hypothetical protein QYF61_027642 [Mycteria americana]|uniref:Uncharacterized protein n=1 Tax=Mycteria americana TaxID=33587 RepID=A0AAN7P1B1_MYCAM|nr:hypothetical protein QYF61_027642 [Mycteria americana]